MAKHDRTADVGEGKIADVAEQLGKIIGTARARVDSWKGERQAMVKQLSRVVAEAQDLLRDLGHQAQNAASAVGRAVGRGTGRGTKNERRRKGGRPKGSTLSAEARARISAAQKARWAKIKAAKKR